MRRSLGLFAIPLLAGHVQAQEPPSYREAFCEAKEEYLVKLDDALLSTRIEHAIISMQQDTLVSIQRSLTDGGMPATQIHAAYARGIGLIESQRVRSDRARYFAREAEHYLGMLAVSTRLCSAPDTHLMGEPLPVPYAFPRA